MLSYPPIYAFRRHCCSDSNEKHFITSFIFNNNVSSYEMIRLSARIREKWSHFPSFNLGLPSSTEYSSEFLLMAWTSPLKFITADGVTPLIQRHPIASPFDVSTWALGALSTIFLAIIASTLREDFVESCAFNTISVGSAMLDQAQSVRMTTHSFRKISLSIILLWRLLAIVLSFSYKGILKSNYCIKEDFKTSWTSIMQLEGFKLYFPLMSSWNHEMDYNWSDFEMEMSAHANSHRELSFATEKCIFRLFKPNEPFFECTIPDALLRLHAVVNKDSSDKYVEWQTKYTLTFVALIERMEFVCNSSFENVIRTKLTAPNTAMVVPQPKLSDYWNKFKKVQQDTGVKFAVSGDGALRNVHGYRLRGLQSSFEYICPVTCRLKSLASSGVYGLWKKWEGLRNEFHVQRTSNSKEGPRPLALFSSNVAFVFGLYIVSNAITTLAFLFQILRDYCKQQ